MQSNCTCTRCNSACYKNGYYSFTYNSVTGTFTYKYCRKCKDNCSVRSGRKCLICKKEWNSKNRIFLGIYGNTYYKGKYYEEFQFCSQICLTMFKLQRS